MKYNKLIWISALVLVASSLLVSQGSGTPSTLRVRTDANGYLMSAGAAQTPPYTTSTFSNTRLKTDSNGNLLVASSGGIAPADATYITQTANSGLSNEQALGLLASGLLGVTTTTGVVSSTQTPTVTGAVTSSFANTAASTTANFGLRGVASTAAALNTQQDSPWFELAGNGWNNNTNASHVSNFVMRVRPIQGNPVTSQLALIQSINAENTPASYSTVGTWTNTGNYTAAGAVNGVNLNVTTAYLANGNTIYALSTPTITSGFSTTTPSIVGRASAFAVTIAATPGVTGTVAFNTTFTNIPSVTCTNTIGTGVVQAVPTTTTVVLNGVWLANDVIRCIAISY